MIGASAGTMRKVKIADKIAVMKANIMIKKGRILLPPIAVSWPPRDVLT